MAEGRPPATLTTITSKVSTEAMAVPWTPRSRSATAVGDSEKVGISIIGGKTSREDENGRVEEEEAKRSALPEKGVGPLRKM